jgi:hypothetical protein
MQRQPFSKTLLKQNGKPFCGELKYTRRGDSRIARETLRTVYTIYSAPLQCIFSFSAYILSARKNLRAFTEILGGLGTFL